MQKKTKWILGIALALVAVSGTALGIYLTKGVPWGDALYESVMITPEKTSEMGVDPTSGFHITTGYRVSQESLRAMLAFDPPLEAYTFEGSGKQWILHPTNPLAENAVYTVRVRKPDGKDIRSFAFQTRSDLLVNSVFPSNRETYVDVSTGIEMGFNVSDVDITDAFSIEPPVAGKFEQKGYTAVFIPDAPLEWNSGYRVHLAAGLRAPDGRELQEEHVFQFVTRPEQGAPNEYDQLRLKGDFASTSLLGDAVSFSLYAGREMGDTRFDVQLYRYPSAEEYVGEIQRHAKHERDVIGPKKAYASDTDGLELISSSVLAKDDRGSEYTANIPDVLPEGYYIAAVSGTSPSGVAQLVHKLIHVTTLSAYVQSTEGEVLVWLNDGVSGNPVSGMQLQVETLNGTQLAQAATGEDGVVQTSCTVPEKDDTDAYLRLTQDGKTIYFTQVALSKNVEKVPLNEIYRSALYTDREIYRPSDTIQCWGTVLPRAKDGKIPEKLYASLSSSWPRSEISRTELTIRSDGVFKGEISLDALKAEWYEFSITDGTKEGVYYSHGLMVEEFTKPPFVITVKSEKDWYYANEPIALQMTASYYDGTPVANGSLRLESSELLESRDGGAVVQLDAAGRGVFKGTYASEGGNNWDVRSVWYNVSPASTEDVYVTQGGTIQVLPSKIAMELKNEVPGSVTVRTAQVDESHLTMAKRDYTEYPTTFGWLAGAPVDIPFTVEIKHLTSQKIPTGSYYDEVQKKTITQYSWEQKEAVVSTSTITTSGGNAQFEIPFGQVSEDGNYTATVSFEGNVIGTVSDTIYSRNTEKNTAVENKRYYFSAKGGDTTSVKPNGDITLSLYENGEKIPNAGRVLYTVSQRGIRSRDIYAEDDHTLKFDESLLPNIWIVGAYFDGRYVHTMQANGVRQDYADQQLQVQVQADSESYRPADVAKLTVTLKDAQGKPTAGTACVGVVDESVFALAEQELDLARQLYADVFQQGAVQMVTERGVDMMMKSDVATGGGGSPDVPRADFLDTALFKTLEVDETGIAQVEIPLPDNITAWRATAGAVTADARIGNGTGAVVSTLPFYVRPLVTSSYLSGDAVTLSAVAVGEKPGDAVHYTMKVTPVDGSPIALEAEGKVGEQAIFSLGKLPTGEYEAIVTGNCGTDTDTVRQTFFVAEEGLVAQRVRDVPIGDLATLESQRYPVTLTFYDKLLAPYMHVLEILGMRGGERTEEIVASYMARMTRAALLDEKRGVARDKRLDDIQREDGGIKFLPQSDSDVTLTAKMLVAAPELLRTQEARRFLREKTGKTAITPSERAMAFMGLAALREPVLLDLKRELEVAAASEALTLAAGLALLGDMETANTVFDKYATQAKPEEALLLAALLRRPEADTLALTLCQDINTVAKSGKSDTGGPWLEMLAYVSRYELAGSKDTTLRYEAQGQTKEEVLDARGVLSMDVDREQLKQAGFEASKGDIGVLAGYSTTIDTSSVTVENSSGIEVVKTVEPLDGATLRTAGLARVTLEIVFPDDAPTGSYLLTDRIPSGMRHIQWNGDGKNPLGTERIALWGDLRHEGQLMNGYLWLRGDDEIAPLNGKIRTPSQNATLVAYEAMADKSHPATDDVEVEKPNPGAVASDEEEPIEDAKQNPGTKDDGGKMHPGNPGMENARKANTISPDGRRVYTLVYYVSCALPGEYVLESAMVEQAGGMFRGTSARSSVVIE